MSSRFCRFLLFHLVFFVPSTISLEFSHRQEKILNQDLVHACGGLCDITCSLGCLYESFSKSNIYGKCVKHKDCDCFCMEIDPEMVKKIDAYHNANGIKRSSWMPF